ncbi:MAG: hypothetical protein ACYCZ6_17605 [Polaromonas sp.]
MLKDPEFNKLLTTCKTLSDHFDQGLVYIGGIAVYLHSVNRDSTSHLAEATHDADFYISFADMSDLREIEEVTPNRRLSKSQFIKNGFEFDIYTERISSLRVPYDEVLASSEKYDEMRVASLEHLLVLKLDAFRDRQNSAKGAKDARDIIRIAALATAAQRFNFDLVVPYLDEQHLALFERLRKSPEAITLARGNAVQAKALRKDLDSMLCAIETYQPPMPGSTMAPR